MLAFGEIISRYRIFFASIYFLFYDYIKVYQSVQVYYYLYYIYPPSALNILNEIVVLSFKDENMLIHARNS